MPELGDVFGDEVIKTKFVVDAQKAVEEAKKLRQEIEALKNTMKTVTKETGETTGVVAQSVLNTTQGMVKGSGALAKKEYGESAKAAAGFKGTLSSLGSVGKFVFGSVLGIGAVKVLRDIIGYFKQAFQAGYEFTKAVYQLQIGINAIRRVGVEITLQDVYENLDKLQAKFGIFSRKELVEGSAALINLTRDFGFTKDKIFELQDAIATLAVVNGRAMDDVQRTVALAISSGYTEGLQRLGVSINRVTIALEAQRLGWGKNYMSLTEQQRAQATYNLILEKTAKYQNDLAAYQQTAPGMIDDLKASWTDLKTEIGSLISVYGVYARVLDFVLEGIVNFVREVRKSKINELFVEQAGNIAGVIAVLDAYRDKLKGKPLEGSAVDIFNKAKKGFTEGLKEPVIETGWLRNALEEGERMANELPPIAEEIGDKLLEIEKDFEEESADAWKDYLRDKEDLLIQYGQKAEDIERQAVQKLEDLDIKVTQQKEDAWTDYYQGLEDINIWYNQAIEDANYEHQQNLLKAEEDFQNKMRDLRQKFLFDLEDAIRERDAKQAMSLIRQYNFERRQEEQNRDDNIEDINKQYKIELAELKRQKARKLAELKNELNSRLAEIQLEYQRELEELSIWKQREYEERELWYKRELEQIWDNYEDQMSALRTQRERDLKDLANYLKSKYNYNKRWIDELYKYTEYIIGDKGILTKLWRDYYALSSSLPTPNLTPQQIFNWGGSYANGGEITANKPTLALFGERGAERATFTPLGKSGSKEGKLQIELVLSPDLEARIIDSAMGEFADELETAISIKR